MLIHAMEKAAKISMGDTLKFTRYGILYTCLCIACRAFVSVVTACIDNKRFLVPLVLLF